MKLAIFTNQFSLFFKLKRMLRAILGVSSGPLAVERSVKIGLAKIGVEVVWNPKEDISVDVAWVLSGREGFDQALHLKKSKLAKVLIAGPNLMVLPSDDKELVLCPDLDLYLLPSQWNVDLWLKIFPSLGDKVRVWGAGVSDNGSLVDSGGKFLVYQKTASKEVLSEVVAGLESAGLEYKVLEYGKYKKGDYISTLSECRAVIFLNGSESQGLAMHEAWMAGLPVMVLDIRNVRFGDVDFSGNGLSSPYLNESNGMFFRAGEFAVRLREFLIQYDSFTPREWSLENWTDKRSAEKLIQIITN